MVILTDGREFEGVVAVEKDSVLIVTEHTQLRFPKAQVLRIELKDLPKVELQKRLAAAAKDNPNQLFLVAEWAIKAGLQGEGDKIIADVLKLNPNHAAAREELGHLKIDGKWYPFDKAAELARSRMEAEQLDSLLSSILPGLEKLAARRGKELVVGELTGHTLLRAKKFGEAERTFADMAETAKGNDAIRYSAIATILKENPDGIYVLGEPHPPASHLLGQERVLEAGPASLSNPLVLQAALRDQAKKEILAGQELMAAAKQAEPSQPVLAHAKYRQALRVFERADALVANIARSYRVEIVRRRIGIIRKSYYEDVRKYNLAYESLGTEEIPARTYRRKIGEMIRRVDNVCGPLKEILVLAKPYPEELVLEVRWAEGDLKSMEDIRQVLAEALNESG